MQPSTPEGWEAVNAAYGAVKAFLPRDQVTATAWAVVAVLSAQREQSKFIYEALAYLRQQVAALRFPTTR